MGPFQSKNSFVLFIGIFCAVTLFLYMANTQVIKFFKGLREFWRALHYRMTEFEPSLSHDPNDVDFLLWTRQNKRNPINVDVNASLPSQFNL